MKLVIAEREPNQRAKTVEVLGIPTRYAAITNFGNVAANSIEWKTATIPAGSLDIESDDAIIVEPTSDLPTGIGIVGSYIVSSTQIQVGFINITGAPVAVSQVFRYTNIHTKLA